MKKITALIVTATLAFSLVGCNQNEKIPEEQLNNETVVQEEVKIELTKETVTKEGQDRHDTNSYEYNGKLYEFNEDTKYQDLDQDGKMVWFKLMKSKEYFINRFTKWDRHTPFSREYHELFVLRDDFEDVVKYHAVARIEFKDFDVNYTFEDEILTIDGEVIKDIDRLYEIFAELGDSTENYKSEDEIIEELTNVPFTKENHESYINHPNFKEIIESAAMNTPLPSEADDRRTYKHDEINFYDYVVIDGEVIEDIEELYAFIGENQYVEPDVVVDVEKPEELAVVENNDRPVENTTEESATSPTQENNIATSNSIWDIPRYDQSHLPTREDLFATRGNFTGEKGTISITSTPLNNHVGDARDRFEVVFTPYGVNESSYIIFSVKTSSKVIDDKYKTVTYDILSDDEKYAGKKLVYTTTGIKIGDDEFKRAFFGEGYNKDPYSIIEYKNNKNMTTWLDYTRFVDGIIVEWMNDGSGDKISMVIHVLHDDFSHSESGKTYYYNIYNQTYQGSYEYPMTISKDGIY